MYFYDQIEIMQLPCQKVKTISVFSDKVYFIGLPPEAIFKKKKLINKYNVG